MEIEIVQGKQRLLLVNLAAVLLLLSLTILGWAVTPWEQGMPVFLSPDRWQAARLARRARAETLLLHRDARALAALLDEAQPDPVAAMLLAQGIYARQRTGTSATAPARQSLITAAEITARYAAGSATRGDALAALNAMLERLEKLGR